jgi:hypothetical protein
MQPSPRELRIADPVLTNIARGYRNPATTMIARVLFPTVQVGVRAGRILSFGKEDFMQYATARSPGAKTGRVQFGFASEPFALVDHSLEGMVPRELQEEGANGEPGLNLAQIAIRRVQRIMDLGVEIEAAAIARNSALYGSNVLTLSGTDQWDDPGSTPFADVEAAKEAVRASIGFRPNVLTLAPKVFSALKLNPTVLARTIPTGRDLPSLALLAALFEVDRVLVGDSISSTDDGVLGDVWGKDVILAYVDPAGAAEMGSPSFGYTYQLAGYPFVEPAYQGRNEKTWYYPVTDARKPYLTGPGAGFIIKDAVS